MKYFQKIFFLFLFLSTLEAIEVRENLMMDMSRTYGYYLGQSYALENIEKKYPNLKNEIFLVKNEFDLKYLKSIKEIEQFFMNNLSKKEWNDLKSKVSNGIKKQLNTNISYEEALESIQTGKMLYMILILI
jgi:GTP1/Obg family GTP-binding protein